MQAAGPSPASHPACSPLPTVGGARVGTVGPAGRALVKTHPKGLGVEAGPPARPVTRASLLPCTQSERTDAPSESLGRPRAGARDRRQFVTRAAKSTTRASHGRHSHSAYRVARQKDPVSPGSGSPCPQGPSEGGDTPPSPLCPPVGAPARGWPFPSPTAALSGWPQSTLPLAVRCLKGKSSPPWDFPPEPQEFSPLPPP